MKKREAKITPLITAYIKIKRIYGFFEVKQTTTELFNLSKFEPQQMDSLHAAMSQGLVHKISDEDSRIKPFDIIHAMPMQSYVVIRYPKAIYFILAHVVDTHIREGAKSLTSVRASDLASYTISLSKLSPGRGLHKV